MLCEPTRGAAVYADREGREASGDRPSFAAKSARDGVDFLKLVPEVLDGLLRVEIKNTQSAAATGGTFAGARFELYGTVTGWANANSTFTLTANGVAYTASLAPGATVSGTIAKDRKSTRLNSSH